MAILKRKDLVQFLSADEEIENLLCEMREPPGPGVDAFYCLTLTADETGKVFLNYQSGWTGWADEDRRIEMREPTQVTIKMAEHWESIGQPFLFVKTPKQLAAYMLAGGHGLIVPVVAEMHLADLLTPSPSYLLGDRGFVSERSVEPSAFNRAPTKKLRMQVLNRDRRRCRICGRNPDDNTDVVLNVHHIRPWADAGLTDISNLITLCHTCHGGLAPHFDASLYDYIRKGWPERNREFVQGVANYRRVVADQ